MAWYNPWGKSKQQKQIEQSQKERAALKKKYGESASFRQDNPANQQLQIEKGVDSKKLGSFTRKEEINFHKAIHGQGTGLPYKQNQQNVDYKAQEIEEFRRAFEWQRTRDENLLDRPPLKPEKKVEPITLRYPSGTIDGTQDFIQFSPFTYRRQKWSDNYYATDAPVLSRPSGLVTKDSNQLKGVPLGTITLPIPAQIGDNNSTSWKSGNMNFMQERGLGAASAMIEGEGKRAGQEINKLIEGVTGGLVKNYLATQAVNSLGGNLSLGSVMARQSGQVINPNMELLFDGPSLRQFSFTFKFTPRFQEEAQDVKKIMRAFKKNMAPKGKATNFLKTPNIFQISYIGKASEYLNRFKVCALQNVTINYTADGTFATYDDGSPIASTMTLQFQELTPIYEEDYDETIGGVGY